MTLLDTPKGTSVRVLSFGPEDGEPVVFLHALAGLLDDHRCCSAIADAGFRVLAPELPGYGESTGETLLDDMLDLALHGWDVVSGLGIERPHLVGHGLGGMIAAEMAVVANDRPASLTLVSPSGLWVDSDPVPDVFATLPFALPELLFHDAERGGKLLTRGSDFTDMDALTGFFVANARRLGLAGKVLFPIPNRRLSKRIYRLTAPTALVWGAQDRLHPAGPYAAAWQAAVPHASLTVIDDAGHMAVYEQPDAVAAAVVAHIR